MTQPITRTIIVLAAFALLASCYPSKRYQYNALYTFRGNGALAPMSWHKPFFLRYHMPDMELDIWSDDSVYYTGRLLCHIACMKKQNRNYGIIFPLQDSTAQLIGSWLSDSRLVLRISEDTFAARLQMCNGCVTRSFQYADEQKCFSRHIFSANVRTVVDSFSKFVEQKVEPRSKFSEFVGHLPRGKYRKEDRTIVVQD